MGKKEGGREEGNTFVENNDLSEWLLNGMEPYLPLVISFDLNVQSNPMRRQSKAFICIYYESEILNLF